MENYLKNSRDGISSVIYPLLTLNVASNTPFLPGWSRKSYRALLVKQSEGLLELRPHGLWVRVLHQELGAELSELRELDGAGAVLVNLLNQLRQFLGRRSKAHGSKMKLK